ncbi:MAG: hypothetical protein AB7N71_06720 [Phycisphaerae bacterium]
MFSRRSMFCTFLSAGALGASVLATPLTSSFTYQGRLDNGTAPADGLYDFVFRLRDAASGGAILASQTFDDVDVMEGVFTVSLNFSSTFYDGEQRWLEVQVRPGAGGAYTTLSPRQELTVAPYALYATKPWQKNAAGIVYSEGVVSIGGGRLILDGPFGSGQADNAQSTYCITTGDAANIWNDGTGDAGVFRARGGDAVRGEILSTTGTPGNAVYGLNNHPSEGTGVRGSGWWGVFGAANASNGYGGVFAGSGAFGGGQALWSIGTSLFSSPATFAGGTDVEPGSGGYVIVGSVTGANITIDNNEIMARDNGSTATLFLNNDGGIVRVPVLEITGADMAERFPVRGDAEPGTVMVLDPTTPGQLCVAERAYDKKVAGVVSGAGDIPVGAILGNLPGSEDHPPIAMNGRVWVKCDTSTGAIEIGDMLTTSDSAGHAMKAGDPNRCHGAVIGKAMSSLAANEKGLVLVLVNLQ